jgi:hypothetical protein
MGSGSGKRKKKTAEGDTSPFRKRAHGIFQMDEFGAEQPKTASAAFDPKPAH